MEPDVKVEASRRDRPVIGDFFCAKCGFVVSADGFQAAQDRHTVHRGACTGRMLGRQMGTATVESDKYDQASPGPLRAKAASYQEGVDRGRLDEKVSVARSSLLDHLSRVLYDLDVLVDLARQEFVGVTVVELAALRAQLLVGDAAARHLLRR